MALSGECHHTSHIGCPTAQLTAHFHRQVTDSINSLVNVCTSAAPGQRECDNAIRQIQSLQPLLANPTEPVSDCSYFECLETVMDKSRSLGTSQCCGEVDGAYGDSVVRWLIRSLLRILCYRLIFMHFLHFDISLSSIMLLVILLCDS